ncbi:MAG: hypothetical protein QF437_31875, partial [Planctomycetota bacterium]|nr:hypothetical protein [Planctomycetota bacterium]
SSRSSNPASSHRRPRYFERNEQVWKRKGVLLPERVTAQELNKGQTARPFVPFFIPEWNARRWNDGMME